MGLVFTHGPFADFTSYWANRRAHEAEGQLQQAQQDMHALAERIDHLTLLCRAMWSLVQEKTGLTEADLQQRVHEIDQADGQSHPAPARACPKCGNTLSKRFQRCLYCGYDGAMDALTTK